MERAFFDYRNSQQAEDYDDSSSSESNSEPLHPNGSGPTIFRNFVDGELEEVRVGNFGDSFGMLEEAQRVAADLLGPRPTDPPGTRPAPASPPTGPAPTAKAPVPPTTTATSRAIQAYNREDGNAEDKKNLEKCVIAWLGKLPQIKGHPAVCFESHLVDGSILDLYYAVVNSIFSQGGPLAMTLTEAMLNSVYLFKTFTIYLDSFTIANHPDSPEYKATATSVELTTTLLLMIAASPDSSELKHRRSWPTVNRLKGRQNTSLEKTLKQVQSDLTSSSHEQMVVFHVDLHDLLWSDPAMRAAESRNEYWIPHHKFIIATDNSGLRIFQAFGPGDLTDAYDLGQWISRGGAKLRTWSDAGEWLKSFSTIEKKNPKFTPAINAAWQTCFDVDILRSAKAAGRKLMKPYHPIVQIQKCDNIRREDFTKFSWELDRFRDPATRRTVEEIVAKHKTK